MEENKTRETNKKGGKREREREREKDKLGLRKVKKKSFNSHPYDQEP